MAVAIATYLYSFIMQYDLAVNYLWNILTNNPVGSLEYAFMFNLHILLVQNQNTTQTCI